MLHIHGMYKIVNIIIIFISVISTVAMGADSSLILKGTITEQGCTVDTLDTGKTVSLGEWSVRALRGMPGLTTSPVPFTIHLTNCTADTVKTTFTGTENTARSGFISLSEVGSAKGVAVELLEENGSFLPLNQASSPVYVTSDGKADLVFKARYISTESDVSAGSATAEAIFRLTYE
ncbi:fimbrial protein [Klebsiella electrica]|uniref:fimbrial protein n=1 Tax=Klebsiella electrica TaxID=1259973 RepID=UPI003F76FC41